MLLLLLREHVRLLRLQMRQRVRVGAHTRLHAHHGPSLAHRTIGTRHAWVHALRHLLAWIGAWTAHGVDVGHASLGMHAGVVWIARGHHLGCSAVRATPRGSREGSDSRSEMCALRKARADGQGRP
jgi:hypothetical protein